jgi:hypothetical protein
MIIECLRGDQRREQCVSYDMTIFKANLLGFDTDTRVKRTMVGSQASIPF